MNVSIGQRWEEFVEETVRTGRFGSASEVVQEGLRLVAEREAKVKAVRELIQESLAEGGENTDEDIDRMIEEEIELLKREGY